MNRRCSFRVAVLVAGIAGPLNFAIAQVVTATVPAGSAPLAVAVNALTNKIYVANLHGNSVTVIDGASNNTTTVRVGAYPLALAVNSTTNKIYVANTCGNDDTCGSLGTVTVIDGATNNTTTIMAGSHPQDIAVNPVTNKIYALNQCGHDIRCLGFTTATVTVIDGATNNTSTINAGVLPYFLAVNTVTNQIYVSNYCGNDLSCNSMGTVTAIDGVTNNTRSINVGADPYALTVNPVTNKVYVVNTCGNDLRWCRSGGTVTVIDGSTYNTQTVTVGAAPYGIAENSITNKIYVANALGDRNPDHRGTVTVIDGLTSNTVSVDVGIWPFFPVVDSTANEIYVPNQCGSDPTCNSAGVVSVIDGATNRVMPAAVGDSPNIAAVNPATRMVYVPNFDDGTVSIVASDTALQFVNVSPCRLLDTREGLPIQGGSSRAFNLPQLAQMNGCADLSSAAAYSLNVTLIPSEGSVGYLTIWPTPQARPSVSTMNSDGRIKANAVTIQAGVSGAVSVYVTDTADVVLDINGYYTARNSSTLEFYPLNPCRVLDTRNADGLLGGPYLQSGQERDFPVLSSECHIPSSAQAYSMNFTVAPYSGQPLGYLSVWPTGEPRPAVSTLNNLTATIVANGAIVPAGRNGEISVYPSGNTHLIADINGYFAAPAQGGQSLYPTPLCRVVDTRNSDGAFTGELAVDVAGSTCDPPAIARAYVLNATAIPTGPLGYLTLWPYGEGQPLVSTLNAIDGVISSNMAIVANSSGLIDTYASGTTNLILDIFGFFAP